MDRERILKKMTLQERLIPGLWPIPSGFFPHLCFVQFPEWTFFVGEGLVVNQSWYEGQGK